MNPTIVTLSVLGPKKKHGDDYYITVSVTVVECDISPELAVTIIGYMPAGVPLGLLPTAALPPDQVPVSPFVQPSEGVE
jgi:hypothetical protein